MADQPTRSKPNRTDHGRTIRGSPASRATAALAMLAAAGVAAYYTFTPIYSSGASYVEKVGAVGLVTVWLPAVLSGLALKAASTRGRMNAAFGYILFAALTPTAMAVAAPWTFAYYAIAAAVAWIAVPIIYTDWQQ